MELKKYVLNTITKRLYMFEKQDVKFVDFYRGMHESDKAFIIHSSDLTNIHITSDNILDLVEVGDLIEFFIADYPEFRYVKHTQSLWQHANEITNSIVLDGNRYAKQDLRAIYKLQSNGDYKRYDV